MGQAGPTKCEACGHEFELWTGGGFEAQIVFCEECGRGTSVFHFKKPLGDGDETAVVGSCSHCSGSLRLNAPPRCPGCRSTKIERGSGEFDLHWD